jgi:dienelactone hydrolase
MTGGACGVNVPSASPSPSLNASTVPAELLAIVAYEPGNPTVRLGAAQISDGVTVQQMTFATPFGDNEALITLPPGEGPFPVVLFGHPTNAGARFFVGEATALAGRGLAGIAVDLPYRPPFDAQLNSDERDRTALLQSVIVLRRAIDALETLPAVNATRVGYEGLSIGATVGAQLVAIDRRVDGAVLMSGVAHVADYTTFPLQPNTRDLVDRGELDEYLESMLAVDPITYVGHAAPTPILFQFGELDFLVPRESAEAMVEAAGPTAEARWYDAAHELDEIAEEDRGNWLVERLLR